MICNTNCAFLCQSFIFYYTGMRTVVQKMKQDHLSHFLRLGHASCRLPQMVFSVRGKNSIVCNFRPLNEAFFRSILILPATQVAASCKGKPVIPIHIFSQNCPARMEQSLTCCQFPDMVDPTSSHMLRENYFWEKSYIQSIWQKSCLTGVQKLTPRPCGTTTLTGFWFIVTGCLTRSHVLSRGSFL